MSEQRLLVPLSERVGTEKTGWSLGESDFMVSYRSDDAGHRSTSAALQLMLHGPRGGNQSFVVGTNTARTLARELTEQADKADKEYEAREAAARREGARMFLAGQAEQLVVEARRSGLEDELSEIIERALGKPRIAVVPDPEDSQVIDVSELIG